MKRSPTVSAICFDASFWPACIIVVLSILLSSILFNFHISSIIEKEINRHELINQLTATAATTDIIIENEDALYTTLDDFKKKYHLEELFISDTSIKENKDLLAFLKTQKISSSWPLIGLVPEKYIVIHSKIDKKMILIPCLTSFGIILLFVIASVFMYQRIKRKLHFQIVEPLNQTLYCDGEDIEWINNNRVASEIVSLFKRTNDFIKTLHQQRDIIEQHNVQQAKYELALQVAHDIRSPVLALETICELIHNIADEEKFMIRNVTKRISQIADDILAEYQPRNITDTCTLPVVEIVKMIFEEKKNSCKKEIKFELTIDKKSKDKITLISEKSLNRILSNIIDNSIDAIYKDGFIQIHLYSNNDHIEISIKDTGCGIQPHNLKNIFERGLSLNKISGKGLGLSYVKEVIENNNGKIKIQSTPKKGTSIHILLPLVSNQNKL